MNICRKVGAVLLTAALAVSLGLTALPAAAGAAFDSSGNGSNTIRVHFTPGGNTFSTGTDEFSITRQGYRLYRIAGISLRDLAVGTPLREAVELARQLLAEVGTADNSI